MSNTYTQLYIHIVFAVKNRAALLSTDWDERLRLYIIATVQNNGHKMLSINNMPDHVHMFIGLNPAQSVSDLMRLVKGDSSEWINKERLTKSKFQWQEGYGAFSYSKSQLVKVVNYINNQQEHHKKTTFLDEYRQLLTSFDIAFDERYIFKEPE
ncbi:IS200/IS605 family transposase [Mucilaginibacter terrigena]|uniref:IS200/IS605 family transposase n=1 Tax=Mucilaginibacter terrigena TaxID=2492395 RepID=A0A4Q5LP57_9SPHI|nr:IS200/IS605 family transposase [Mucilaginibacter terrigena]RYU91152.1 IS200/IS605 family transposase [Mucilaginibacter terrigena]